MCEVQIRIPTSGENMRVAVLGERQEKLGGVTGSEYDERVMQDRSCSPLGGSAVCQPEPIIVHRKDSFHLVYVFLRAIRRIDIHIEDEQEDTA